MTIDDLRLLFDYGYWANERLFGVVSQLTPDEFARHVAGSYGSVRNTLVHGLSTEWGWLDRCGGPARGPRLEPHACPTPDSLIADWRRSRASPCSTRGSPRSPSPERSGWRNRTV